MSTQALKAVATGQPAVRKPTNFPALLDAYKGEIARALPRHLNAETMTRVALTCFRMNPKLEECKPASVFAAVIQASQLGLHQAQVCEYTQALLPQCVGGIKAGLLGQIADLELTRLGHQTGRGRL